MNEKILGRKDDIPMTYAAHYALCRFAERKTGNPEIDGCRVQLIQIWRGAGKSYLVTNGRSIQRLLGNMNYSIGIANERQENANAFLAGIALEFQQNQLLKVLFPEIVPDNIRKHIWKSDRIVVKRTKANSVNPSVLAAGIGATVTGVHLNEWIVDDIISQDAAENARAGLHTEIEKANRWVNRLPPLLDRPNHDPITFIGTPWWIGDTYTHIEDIFSQGEKPKFHLWSLKLPNGKIQRIQIETKGQLAIFRHYPIDQETGEAVWPEGGLTLKDLEDQRQRDPVFFAAQYLLKPGAGDASFFDETWFAERGFEWESRKQIRWKDTDKKTHFDLLSEMRITMSVDPAISKRKEADESAIVVTASNGTQIFVLEAWSKRVGATELAHKLLEFYLEYKPERVIVETVAYQEALVEIIDLVKGEHGIEHRLPIFEYKTGSDDKKRVRIMGLEPYMRKGLIYVHHQSQHTLLGQIRNYPHTKHDDILDALAMQKSSWERLSTSGASDDSRKKWKQRSQEVVAKHRNRRKRRG